MEYKIHSEDNTIYTLSSSDTLDSSQKPTPFTYPTLDNRLLDSSIPHNPHSSQMPSSQTSAPHYKPTHPACDTTATEKSIDKKRFLGCHSSKASLIELNWGTEPQIVLCPFCNEEAETKVEKSRTGKAWSICCAMCVVGLWPCCLIPLYCNKWKTTVHKCPNCHIVLGRHVE
jgi:hypothetical protein